jgi:hypothetical protein
MGLDMYAYRVKRGMVTEQVDFEVPENADDQSELHYWRKHPNLHGWMERLYYDKGGKEDVFNCVNVQLTEDDLDRLEKSVINENLPHTEGFFFGESQPDDRVDDLEFIKKARKAIFEGDDVYYTSCWTYLESFF